MPLTILNRHYWIFDLDGTLTLAVHDFGAIKQALEIPQEADILAHLDSLPPEVSEPLHRRLDEIEQDLCHHAQPAEGAALLLEGLRNDGCRLGILTRNSRDAALVTLERAGLAGYFSEEEIVGRRQAAPKPDPEGILYLANRWQCSPEEMVMVGDYLYDLACGRGAGTATVHVDPTEQYRWPELADVRVRTLGELAEMRCRARF